MPTIHFVGRVIPREATVSLDAEPKVEWSCPERGLEMSFSLRIHSSEVKIECEVNRYTPGDLVHIYLRAFDLAKSSVGLVAFAMGFGLTVILEEFTDPDGTTKPVLLGDPRLPPLCSAFKINTNKEDTTFNEVLLKVLLSPPLQMVLDDLIEAISLPHRSPVNSARAIERLRNLIAPAGLTRKEAWKHLRDNLHIGQNYLEFITNHSAGPRHGDPTHIPGHVTDELTVRAWNIMNRFLEFRRRGDKPLPETEFPILS